MRNSLFKKKLNVIADKMDTMPTIAKYFRMKNFTILTRLSINHNASVFEILYSRIYDIKNSFTIEDSYYIDEYAV